MKKKNPELTDSGYDCDHCGGEIYIGQKITAGRPLEGYYVCRRCGCEWTLKGDVLHIGVTDECQSSQRQRMNKGVFTLPTLPELSRWRRALLIVGGVLLFLVLLRFGGFMVFRFLLPLLVLGVIVYLVYQFGRERSWW